MVSRVWDKGMEKGKEFQVVGAEIRNE